MSNEINNSWPVQGQHLNIWAVLVKNCQQGACFWRVILAPNSSLLQAGTSGMCSEIDTTYHPRIAVIIVACCWAHGDIRYVLLRMILLSISFSLVLNFTFWLYLNHRGLACKVFAHPLKSQRLSLSRTTCQVVPNNSTSWLKLRWRALGIGLHEYNPALWVMESDWHSCLNPWTLGLMILHATTLEVLLGAQLLSTKFQNYGTLYWMTAM